MSLLLKLRDHSRKKLNNAEYAFFSNGVIDLVRAGGEELLHAPAEVFASYCAKTAVLDDMVAKTRATKETVKIAEIDAEVDSIIQYIFAVITKAKEMPIASKREAGVALGVLIEPYLILCRLPRRQKIQTVKSLLADLAKSDLSPYVETLGLGDEVEALTLKNAQYLVLINTRANIQMVYSEENSKTIRAQMEELYDELVYTIWAYGVTQPSEEATAFVKSLNKLIQDCETAYNQRIGQLSRKDGSEEPSGNDGESSEQEGEEVQEEDVSGDT